MVNTQYVLLFLSHPCLGFGLLDTDQSATFILLFSLSRVVIALQFLLGCSVLVVRNYLSGVL
jgi:hypothetical protein